MKVSSSGSNFHYLSAVISFEPYFLIFKRTHLTQVLFIYVILARWSNNLGQFQIRVKFKGELILSFILFSIHVRGKL